VAIASTSGDIGFLQQFTDNKSVLHAAAGRLIQHPYNVRDLANSQTPMTENMALAIERREDPGVLDFYIERCLREAFPLNYKRATCEVEVVNRARAILLQAASVISNTYGSLESLMRSSAQLPGRKLVFFISDGFLLDTGPRNSDPRLKLNQITDTALRAGVVIYTIDARGLFSGQADATNNIPFDPQNRLESTALREGPISQDALNALAGDTGGRALRNQNVFDRWVNKVLEETSNYYLLAWRPNNEEQTGNDFKNITARVIDHPEYSVRLPRGFLKANASPASQRMAEAQAPAQSHRDLQQALTSLYPKAEIPTSLSLVFLDTPEHGPVLTASVRVSNETLSYEVVEGRPAAAVDVVGVVLNDKGKPNGTFQTRLKISPPTSDSTDQNNSATIYNARVPLAPGLYQVRVASRDGKNGQVGSAQQWVQIPDLALHRLTLSSLLLGLQTVELKQAGPPGVPQVQFNVDHRFARNSRLGFMAFVYNAVRGQEGKSLPYLSIQARVLKLGQPVLTTPVWPVKIEPADLARIFCGGEIQLGTIPPGQYILEVTVTDQFAKTSAAQQTRFTVE
jgi:VWFA-related protein